MASPADLSLIHLTATCRDGGGAGGARCIRRASTSSDYDCLSSAGFLVWLFDKVLDLIFFDRFLDRLERLSQAF